MLPPASDLQASLFPDSSAQIREPVNVIKIGSALASDGKRWDENKSFYQDTKAFAGWGGGDNVSFPSLIPSDCRLPTVHKHLPRSVFFALLKRKGERHSRFLPPFSSQEVSHLPLCCSAWRLLNRPAGPLRSGTHTRLTLGQTGRERVGKKQKRKKTSVHILDAA